LFVIWETICWNKLMLPWFVGFCVINV